MYFKSAELHHDKNIVVILLDGMGVNIMEANLEKDGFFRKIVLMTKQEVIESGLFGTGKEQECFRGMLGDYLAVAVSDLSIYNTEKEAEHFIGVHAGISPEEMTIPLILIERKN